MKSSNARRGEARKLSKIFGQLRLLAARVILCYGGNRTGLKEDIRRADHICELSEEYVFRSLCLWLITTYGSLICNPAMQVDLARAASLLETAFGKLNEYPFANLVPDLSFKEFNDLSKPLLNGCSAGIEILGDFYEHIQKFPMHIGADGSLDIPTHIQEKDKRRLVGQFYTPASIVDKCLDKAIDWQKENFISRLKSSLGSGKNALTVSDSVTISGDLKIFDPSCGSGNFLLGVLRLIRKTCQPLDREKFLSFLGSGIHGAELDGRAACLARIGLVIASVDSWSDKSDSFVVDLVRKLRRNIKNSDTLYASPWQTASDAEAVLAESYDLVITNPPYVSFGARNQPKLVDSATKYLRAKFPCSAEYKIRIHSIFQEIALRYTRNNGAATLLVPDGFLTGGYYKQLRQMLTAQSQLCSLAELPSDTVPGAVVGRWCVATYMRSFEPQADYQVKLFSYIEPEPMEFSLSKSLLVSRDQNRFRLVFNEIDTRLAELIDGLEPLSREFRGHTGMRALHGQSSIVADTKRGKSWKRGIISGTSVLPHVVAWKGDWLNVDSRLLYKGGFDPRIIESPKILIRQTGDRIVAAYDADCLYHLNNVHSVSPINSDGRTLDFLDGLMNSSFWLYVYRLKTREQGRALAQIDIETLESMPMPRQNPAIEKQIGALSRLHRSYGVRTPVDLCRRIEHAIDKLVYDIYELDDRTVQQIEVACGKLSDNVVVLPTQQELLYLQHLADSDEVVCAFPSP